MLRLSDVTSVGEGMSHDATALSNDFGGVTTTRSARLPPCSSASARLIRGVRPSVGTRMSSAQGTLRLLKTSWRLR